MQDHTADTTVRNERLKEISRITWLCFERDGWRRSLCPSFSVDADVRRDALKRITLATKEIKVRAFHLNRLERGRCGFRRSPGSDLNGA